MGMALPAGINAWAPRDALMPQLRRTSAGGLLVLSNGSPGCYGGWELTFDLQDSPGLLVASVNVRWADLGQGSDSLQALIQWVDSGGNVPSWAPLEISGNEEEWCVLRSRPLERPSGCRLIMRLLVRWSSTGWAEWADPHVADAAPIPARRLRLGAGSSHETSELPTLTQNRDRYMELCRRAGGEGVDLLCLPETILSEGMSDLGGEDLAGQAVDVPGEQIEPFTLLASQYGMAIAFSVFERSSELVYNTGVLIDAHGSIALKYRKVHLAIKEAWRGVTPGEGFSVVDLPPTGTRVGMNICMDSSSVESARVVAAMGAEILLLPIENDFRATRWKHNAEESKPFSLPRWTVIQQARALDNHLYVVAARNAGVGTGIFGPDGTVLAMDYGDSPLVIADVDVADLARHPTGPPYRDVIWFQRRAATYTPLLRSM